MKTRARARVVPTVDVAAGQRHDRGTADPVVTRAGRLRVDVSAGADFLVLRGFRHRAPMAALTVVAHAHPDDDARAAAVRFRFLARRAIDSAPALAPAGVEIEAALEAFEQAAYVPASLDIVRRLDRLDRMWFGNAVLSTWAA